MKRNLRISKFFSCVLRRQCNHHYPHFKCNNQILRTEANLPKTSSAVGCKNCWHVGRGKCKHNIGSVTLNERNPKLPVSGTECGGGYANRLVRFIVPNEMAETPVSLISGIGVIKELGASVNNLVEKELELGESEVLNLLKDGMIFQSTEQSILS